MKYIVILTIILIICIVYLKTHPDMIEKLIKLPLLNIIEVVRENYGEENVSFDINKLLLSMSLVISLTLSSIYLLLINVKSYVVQQEGGSYLSIDNDGKLNDIGSDDDLYEMENKKYFIL